MKNTYDVVISSGTIVTATETFMGDIGIRGEKIVALSSDRLQGQKVIDAKNLVVLPGVIDLHVHFSEPGRAHWEGWQHGCRAAALGGVTTVVEMPLNAVPATTTVEALEQKLATAKTSIVDYALWGGFVDNNLSELETLSKTGIIGFKAFMVDTKDDTFRFVNHDLLREGMKVLAKQNRLLALHAEDNVLTWKNTDDLQARGRTDRRAWAEARTVEVELTAVQTALELARETRCALHIVHVSSPEAVALIQTAKKRGQRVTLETCPHYLILTDDDLVTLGPVAKCAPPLRGKTRQEQLWQQLLRGEIDCIASDHSPCPTEDKTKGENNIWQAWGGITGIQTMLPLMISEGVHKHGMSLVQLAQLMSTQPAKIAGLYPRKGELRLGADADIVMVDMNKEWCVEKSWLASKHQHSPFVDWEMKGKIVNVLRRGEVIVAEDKVVVEDGGVWQEGLETISVVSL
jgi:allantoinase